MRQEVHRAARSVIRNRPLQVSQPLEEVRLVQLARGVTLRVDDEVPKLDEKRRRLVRLGSELHNS